MSESTKPSPLEALKSDPNAITKVVYGPDHPGKKQRRGKPAPAAKRPPHGGSQVGDLIPSATRQKLAALQGKLEAAQSRMKKGKS